MTDVDEIAAEIELIPATRDHEAVLANLLELYIYDFSEVVDVPLGPDGRFGYKGLPQYFIDADHHLL